MNLRPDRLFLFPLFLICCLVVASSSHALELPVRPARYVVDLAGVIDDTTEGRLNRFLLELEQKTTAQFVILTIPGLEGESIEEFSIEVAHNRWRLGQKGKDNGVLLVVAIKEHRYRFEIGYGLEGILPDSLVGSLGRTELVPRFRKGEFSQGIYAAALRVIGRIADARGVRITGMPVLSVPVRRVNPGSPHTLCGSISSILFFLLLAILFIRNPRLFLLLFLASSMGGRRGPWGGGGGGFGGFGGGGGGGFGGGGASGSW